jgi:hypothetical protein
VSITQNREEVDTPYSPYTMPLLQFYTSPNQLTQAEREQLSAVITAFYARLFPAFFVAIVFNEVCPTSSSTL